jgi:hypothetical protein
MSTNPLARLYCLQSNRPPNYLIFAKDVQSKADSFKTTFRVGIKDASSKLHHTPRAVSKRRSQSALGSQFTINKKGCAMLWTIFVILMILWLLGMVSSYTLGGFIHILLVIAIVVVLIRVIQGRNPI